MVLDERIVSEAVAARGRLIELQNEMDHVRADLHAQVRRLHANGGSLREIADCLGMSHQRVHQIVDESANAPRRGRHRRRDLAALLEGAAADAIGAAEDEARAFGHSYVGTEHLLLGLLREADTPAARALAAVGVHADDVRRTIVAFIGACDRPSRGRLRLRPRFKKALKLAAEHAAAAGRPAAESADLLLGLVEVSDGMAARILAALGVDRDQFRAALP